MEEIYTFVKGGFDVYMHCGHDISLYQSDLRKEPTWFHNVDAQQYCPGTTWAEPEAEEQP